MGCGPFGPRKEKERNRANFRCAKVRIDAQIDVVVTSPFSLKPQLSIPDRLTQEPSTSIYVGKEFHLFTVHTSLLTYYSPVAANQLADKTAFTTARDARTRSPVLPSLVMKVCEDNGEEGLL